MLILLRELYYLHLRMTLWDCDIVIDNNKCVFRLRPDPGTELPKPLEFRKWWEYKNVFSYANEVTFGKCLRMTAGCQENQLWD